MSTLTNRTNLTQRLVVSAMLLAIGTVISEFLSFRGLWAAGGSVTFGSTLPLVLLSFMYGPKWGTFSALTYSLLQLVLGLNNVSYAPNWYVALAIILLDYVIAFTVIGLAGLAKGRCKATAADMTLGIVITYILRFLCHFIVGWVVWDALWPNEFGYSGPLYSLFYNGSFMLPETIISVALAIGLSKVRPIARRLGL